MLDTSRLPVGEKGWRQLLNHVVADGDKAEAHYLEIKGPLDLDDRAHRAKVAKFLLGAANRDPEVAARHYEGHAILVIGVGAGKAEGVPAGTEPHNLENGLKKYVGEDFPGLEMTRLAVEDGREVLFIVAFPPKDGDLIYPCHASLEDEKSLSKRKPYLLTRSAIYIRSSSETRQATPEEIKMLSRRAQRAGRKAVTLELKNLGPVHRLIGLEKTISTLYDIEASDYRKRHRDAPPLSSPSLLAVANVLGGEQSTPQQREQRLRNWTAARAVNEAAAREHFLASLLRGFSFTVVSPGRSIEGPRLELRLHGCEAVDFVDEDEPTWTDFIEPVHKPMSPFAPQAYLTTPHHIGGFNNPISWEQQGEDVIVTMELDSLRPDSPWSADADDLVVLARDPSTEGVTVSWRLTERGSDDHWAGEDEIATAAPQKAIDVFKDRVLSEAG